MVKSKQLIALIVVLFLIVVGILISKNTFSYQYNERDSVLFYTDDYNVLKNNIKLYLESVDDYLIPNSSFSYSNVLTMNYDFLTNYALDYIINNKDLYSDRIIKLDEYHYHNIYFEDLKTNEYVPVELIYEITDRYFGIKYYNIINDNVNIINDNVSLSDYTPDLFQSSIIDINLSENGDVLDVISTYDSHDKYKYSFKKVYNVLKIYNIEVLYE